MATIIDPLGTPSIVYNKSGTVLIAMNAAGNDASTGAAIPNVSGHAIVVATWVGNSDYAVVLPSGNDIGDIIEIFGVFVFNNTISVFPAAGETVQTGSQVDIRQDRGCRFIKTSSTNWSYIGGV